MSKETVVLKGHVETVGRWVARETQKRKYETDEVQALSDALMALKAHFDKTEGKK